MKYSIIGVFLLWASLQSYHSVFAGNVISEKPKTTLLFDGKDMESWEPSYEDGWTIENGTLVPSNKHRKRNDIWTRQDYGDFMLMLQYKLSEGANSGVFYRSDPRDPVQRGFELQLLDGPSRHAAEGQIDKHSNGALYDAVAPSEYNNRPAGEWNALLLYAKGPKVVVFINGNEIAAANFDRWKSPGQNPDGSENKFEAALATLPRFGKIGLQYHGDAVAFRNIRLTEIEEHSPDPTLITPRPPVSDEDLSYWLNNMIGSHRFSDAEAAAATGLSAQQIALARKRLGIKPGSEQAPIRSAPLRVMPYPGGRHPRLGFLNGGMDPQRETKLSVFLPWDESAYAVVDVPEAIHSNLGLAYLAHTHVPTIWTATGTELEPLEWTRNEDGSFAMERTLPNGIAYTAYAVPTEEAVHMRLTLTNNTAETLSGLRVQNCVMLRGAPEFAELTRENKLFAPPYAAVGNPERKRWIISAWEPCVRAWGNDTCPCLHSDPQFPDCPPGQTVEVSGVLAFHEGSDIDAAFADLEASAWRSFFER